MIVRLHDDLAIPLESLIRRRSRARKGPRKARPHAASDTPHPPAIGRDDRVRRIQPGGAGAGSNRGEEVRDRWRGPLRPRGSSRTSGGWSDLVARPLNDLPIDLDDHALGDEILLDHRGEHVARAVFGRRSCAHCRRIEVRIASQLIDSLGDQHHVSPLVEERIARKDGSRLRGCHVGRRSHRRAIAPREERDRSPPVSWATAPAQKPS